MKQYNNVYVPVYGKDATHYLSDHTPLAESGQVIVLTIEEAFDLWSAGQKRGWAEALHGEEDSGEPNFEPYLKSKGINITENGK